MDSGINNSLPGKSKGPRVVGDHLIREAVIPRELENSYLGKEKQIENITIHGEVIDVVGKKLGNKEEGEKEVQKKEPKQQMNFDDREARNELNSLKVGKHRHSTKNFCVSLTRSSQK